MPKETLFYELLGVTPDATDAELKKGFRAMSLRYHPDKNPQSEELFKEISYAYRILSDAKTRQTYDSHGAEYLKDPLNFVQLFMGKLSRLKSWFGGSAAPIPENREQINSKPKARFHSIPVDLGELYSGAERKLQFKANIVCEACKNNNNIIDCAKCHGNKTIDINVALDVKIKKGMRNGTEIRVIGAKYDLPFDIDVSLFEHSHRTFGHIHGDDISTIVWITAAEAANGFEKMLDTLDGRTLPIGRGPGEARRGEKFAIPGEGLPREKRTAERGDLIVEFQIR